MHLNRDLLFFCHSMTTHAGQGRAGLTPPLESSTEVGLETSYIHFGTETVVIHLLVTNFIP